VAAAVRKVNSAGDVRQRRLLNIDPRLLWSRAGQSFPRGTPTGRTLQGRVLIPQPGPDSPLSAW
jgi:hypothetical protein